MMKWNKFQYHAWLVLFALLGNAPKAHSQKNDYVWITGNGSNWHNAATADSISGNVKLDFNYIPVQITFDSIAMYFSGTDVSFSDSNGNLLFYSNGIYVANSLNEPIENGDSLNFGYIDYIWQDPQAGEGYQQGMLALPSVANAPQYYLIQSFADSIPGTAGNGNYVTKILNTLVDMQANGGHGKVLYKNKTIVDAFSSSSLTAVKHGNGRDWWLPVQKRTTNCFYLLLMDSAGFHITDSTCGGPIIAADHGVDHMCFSPDGSKFIYIEYTTGISIYDFDRCTGKLSNLKYLPINPILIDSASRTVGVAVSPNSRFLYVSLGYKLLQFDLWSDSILASADTIATYDGWHLNQIWNGSLFNVSQLAPDGKIYMSTTANLPVYHVINNPDEKGAACNFIQHGVNLHTCALSIPNYPNYRLGSLTQAQCDTLALLNDIQRATKEQQIKVYPNPANDYAIIDYGFTDWSKGPVNLELCNALGQTVYTNALPMYSGLQKIDISGFASGMYTVHVKRQGATVATTKLVKE